MTVYLIAFALAIFGIVFNHRMTPWARKSYVVIILIYVVLILGFRYRTGVDTINYTQGYKMVKTLEHFMRVDFLEERVEPGYYFVCSLCKTLKGDFWTVQMIIAFLTNGGIFLFLYRNCRNVFVGLMFYFLFQWLYFSMEVMREGVAVSIFLLNYKNLVEKKWLKYYLLTFLSLLFHYSAIFLWFIPLARLLKPSMLYICMCIAMLLISPLIQLVCDYIPFGTLTTRIQQYLDVSDVLNLYWRLGEFIRSAFPAIAVWALYKFAKQHIANNHMILLQILLCFGAFAIPIIFSRFTNYTAMFVTVTIANAMFIPNLKVLMKSSFVAFILLTQALNYQQMYTRWVPYVSIFDPKQIKEREEIWKNDFIYFRF